jgi:hypothetical protein
MIAGLKPVYLSDVFIIPIFASHSSIKMLCHSKTFFPYQAHF